MTERPAATPPGWRLAALGILAGGFGAGFAASRSLRAGRTLAGLGAAFVAGATLPIARASRRPPISPAQAAATVAASEAPPTFSVVVAARDEAAVLPRLVADVAAQDYRDAAGRPRFELVVVDDRSVDGSAEAVMTAARAHGLEDAVRVIPRTGVDLPDGKGAALTAAQPDACRGDVVLVLDADARIGPDFLRRAAGYICAGAPALTARRRILDASSSQLAGAQADEQTLDGEIQRARWSWGGCSEFRGDGITLRRELLAAAGGWRAAALTEDIDLSSRVAATSGVRVAWAVDLDVWEEPVRTWGGLWHQRLRWAEGAFRRLFEHGPAELASSKLPVGARLDFATYAAQLIAPPIILGAAVGSLGRRAPGTTLLLVLGYGAAGGILTWDALRWEAAPVDGEVPERPGAGEVATGLASGERLWRAFRGSLFNALWLAVVPHALWDLAVRRGAIRYVKMEHGGSAGEPR